MPFAAALRRWREDCYNREPRPGPRIRPSVAELASACGATQHEVRKWVAGTAAPDTFPETSMVLPRLATALGVPTHEVQAVLFEDHEARFPGVFTKLDQRDRVKSLSDPGRHTKLLSEHCERWALHSTQPQSPGEHPSAVLADVLGTSNIDPAECPARLFLDLARIIRRVHDPFKRRDLCSALLDHAREHVASGKD